MDYEEKARIFQRELDAAGGDIAAALRATERVAARRSHGKLSEADVARLRARRAAGETLTELAQAFGIGVSWCCQLCKGVKRGPRAPAPAPSRGIEIVRMIGAALELCDGWWTLPDRKIGRGRDSFRLARRAAVLGLREARLSWHEIGAVLARDHSTLVTNLPRAKVDADARRIADEVLARLPPAPAAPAGQESRAA